MFRRFNAWLDWQIKYHEDKKRAPEIIARIRRERGLAPVRPEEEQTDAPVPSGKRIKSAASLLLLNEATKASIPAALP